VSDPSGALDRFAFECILETTELACPTSYFDTPAVDYRYTGRVVPAVLELAHALEQDRECLAIPHVADDAAHGPSLLSLPAHLGVRTPFVIAPLRSRRNERTAREVALPGRPAETDATPVPVCVPGSLPGFVGTVTTVAGRGSPADETSPCDRSSEIPHLVDSPPPQRALALGPNGDALLAVK
jgi:hypothetical protein